jgi:hypothetical protein
MTQRPFLHRARDAVGDFLLRIRAGVRGDACTFEWSIEVTGEAGEEGRLIVRWFGRPGGNGPHSAAGSRLIVDAEAFLAGDFVDHLRSQDEIVPGWARLNNLAHGDLQSLRQARRSFIATSSAALDWTETTWRNAERVLANELLEFVENDPDVLTRVQRTVLVPLEFELMRAEAERGLTAFELVQSTRTALRSSIS